MIHPHRATNPGRSTDDDRAVGGYGRYGIVSTAIEAVDTLKQIAGAAKKYPIDSVIQAAFSDIALKSRNLKLTSPTLSPKTLSLGP